MEEINSDFLEADFWTAWLSLVNFRFARDLPRNQA